MSGRLALAGRALRLVAKLAGPALSAFSRYRRFEKHFVRGAVSSGLPEALARQLARDLRPSQLVPGGLDNWKHRGP